MSNTNGHERVSWIEPCVPDSEEARIVYELLTSCGVRTRRALERLHGRAIVIERRP